SIFFVLPQLFATDEGEKTRVIGIIDQTHSLTNEINQRLQAKYKLPNGLPNYSIKEISDDHADIEHLKTIATGELLSKTIEGYFIFPANVLDSGKIEYRAENVGNARDQERFSKILGNIITERRLEKGGYNAEAIRKLMTDIDLKTIKVSKEGEEKESGFLETFFTGYIFIMLLMFLVMTTGQMLIRSVVEEKSNRIVEVLISSCSAQELMTGKIMGLTLLGLSTIAFWVLILVGVNFATPIPFVAVDNLLLLLTYFILGYFMYVGIFITAGATVSTEQEAQQMTGYVTIFMVLPIALAVPVMMNPDSLLVKVITFIPLFTPTIMALRFSVQMPQWWEIITSLIVLAASIYGLMWIAAKVFRIGILITGKRPNVKQIISWLRTE
ncbi:MAG: ABC transporter permease, partial [Bacteroidetes bacterium]|nr:ABC transporter permease [Bacteroidota bacterium]